MGSYGVGVSYQRGTPFLHRAPPRLGRWAREREREEREGGRGGEIDAEIEARIEREAELHCTAHRPLLGTRYIMCSCILSSIDPMPERGYQALSQALRDRNRAGMRGPCAPARPRWIKLRQDLAISTDGSLVFDSQAEGNGSNHILNLTLPASSTPRAPPTDAVWFARACGWDPTVGLCIPGGGSCL